MGRQLPFLELVAVGAAPFRPIRPRDLRDGRGLMSLFRCSSRQDGVRRRPTLLKLLLAGGAFLPS